MLEKQGDSYVPGRMVRASDFADGLDEKNNPEWKTVAYDEKSGKVVAPNGSIGFRWGEEGKWNIEPGKQKLQKTLLGSQDTVLPVAFPYFGRIEHEYFANNPSEALQLRNVPVRKLKL